MSSADVRIRFGRPDDAEVLLEYEKLLFAELPDHRKPDYLFGDSETAALTLTEDVMAPLRFFTVIAEDAGAIVGYARAVPWSFPGEAKVLDDHSMILEHLVVNEARRHEGIGRDLVADIEERSLRARQNVIVAHVPQSQADFYRSTEWEVLPDGFGYAWLPFTTHLRADDPDSLIGFPLMAVRILRPKAIRFTFRYPIVRNRPMLDAADELLNFAAVGRIDRHDLDLETLGMMKVARAARGKAVEELNPRDFNRE